MYNKQGRDQSMDPIPKEDSNIFRILDLPDSMIEEIISSLPIKEAVRTSVLSRGLKDLWKNIPNIELIEEPEGRQQFKAFIDALLTLHNLSSLRNLTLSFQVGEDANQVNEWLSRFINPKIKEVVLNLGRVEQQILFPKHMFQSETLTKLELGMQNIIEFPSPIRIPNLKILILKEVIILNGPSTREFFSSFQSLEELTLIDCEWLNFIDVVGIICRSLKKLVIREWGNGNDDDDDENINGQNAPRCNIVIFGGNQLRSFSYDGNYINDYFLSLHTTSSAMDASVKVHQVGNNWGAGYLVSRLLNSFVNVEKLSITSFAIQALSRMSFSPDLHIPLFRNLVELNVEGSSIDLSSEALLVILRNSPYLKALNFDMTLKICNFMAYDEEIYAIFALLSVSWVLETFYISINHNHDFESPTGEDMLQGILAQIVQFPRAPNSQLEYE
ncbi:hypothetical protein RIF29_37679 [Crotalaria pallida]|uniref:F-box domain-containing protein n=1 Tax=Crotalaria pallida TaxID=3830 RepID=A0AAN9HV99_CROPI